MVRVFTCIEVLAVCLIRPVVSNVGGVPRPLVAASWADTRSVRESLDEVLSSALGEDHRKATDVRIDRLEKQLQPMYASLPKNKGFLGHSTVRYALHRHFVHHHAMYVKGLEPAGEAWNSSSPAGILEDKVPAYVQHLFEQRLQTGLNLHELAVLAAALEHFVHHEDTERLKVAYTVAGYGSKIRGVLGYSKFEDVLDIYMVLFLAGMNGVDNANANVMAKSFTDEFPKWSDTQAFLREVQESIAGEMDGLTFADATRVVEAVMDQYGKHQDGDCREMAKMLAAKEDNGRGRVRLPMFYQSGWQFQESAEYMREIGVLQDEGNGDPSIIIPNYVLSPANCLSTSSIYSVCCIDPCETIIRHLETRVGAPTATPEFLVQLVATFPSATVKAPRSLSPTLVQRLAEISAQHGGQVPLHGRLFAQWLHQAYPRECPFPMKSGTVRPMTAEDWMQERNTPSQASNAFRKEMAKKADQIEVRDLSDGDMEATLPWDSEEELVFQKPPTFAWELTVVFRALAGVGVLYGVLVGLTQAVTNMKPSPALLKGTV